MREEKINLTYIKADFDELDKIEQQLVNKAKRAYSNAYAPYSGFLVGAAILLEDGEIISGNNQENVAYPSALCAERVALYYASANYPDVKVKTIAISAKSKAFEITDVVSPCGACRQVMAEYQQKQKEKIRILLHSPNDQVLIANSVEDLLPFMFNSEQLRKF
ncbi:MAG: cytidine deaminase [Bacteroidota bacterium]|nr:cytidine deaminase [Bacteroidota bacterium]